MEIMQLRYLKEVARQESFTRAAELLHITQSALSKSIAKLEDEVGVKLFERDGNRIHLNPFGKAILRSSDSGSGPVGEWFETGAGNGGAGNRELYGWAWVQRCLSSIWSRISCCATPTSL